MLVAVNSEGRLSFVEQVSFDLWSALSLRGSPLVAGCNGIFYIWRNKLSIIILYSFIIPVFPDQNVDCDICTGFGLFSMLFFPRPFDPPPRARGGTSHVGPRDDHTPLPAHRQGDVVGDVPPGGALVPVGRSNTTKNQKRIITVFTLVFLKPTRKIFVCLFVCVKLNIDFRKPSLYATTSLWSKQLDAPQDVGEKNRTLALDNLILTEINCSTPSMTHLGEERSQFVSNIFQLIFSNRYFPTDILKTQTSCQIKIWKSKMLPNSGESISRIRIYLLFHLLVCIHN